MSKRKMKRDQRKISMDIELTIDDLIESLREEKTKVLQEYPEAERISISMESGPWDDNLYPYVTFYRRETLEEMRNRVDQDREQKERMRKRDRERYERLKKQFEGG